MVCTVSNLRHASGEPVVMKPFESNCNLETRSPHSDKPVKIADEPHSGSGDSSNDFKSSPTR